MKSQLMTNCRHKPDRTLFRRLAVTIGLLVAATVALEFSGIDVLLPGIFHNAEDNRFNLHGNRLLLRFDTLAILPGLAIGVGGMIVGIIGYVRHQSTEDLRRGLFVLLALLIGPGVIINGTKGTWGRPRPRDTITYGGVYEHRPVWSPGDDRQNCRSFPCGHASMGFYLMIPMFLGVGSRRWGGGKLSLALGLFWGSLIGLSRFVQGGHYVSDIMWSAGIVYMTGIVLQAVLLSQTQQADYEAAPETGQRLAA